MKKQTITIENGVVSINGRVAKDAKEVRQLGCGLMDIAKAQREQAKETRLALNASKKAARATQLASKKAEREKKAAVRIAERRTATEAKIRALQIKLEGLSPSAA